MKNKKNKNTGDERRWKDSEVRRPNNNERMCSRNRSRSQRKRLDSSIQDLHEAIAACGGNTASSSSAVDRSAGPAYAITRATTSRTMKMQVDNIQAMYRWSCRMLSSTTSNVFAAESNKLSRRIRQVVRSTVAFKAFRGT